MGQFLGWNSWNVFQAPLALFDHAFDGGNQPNAGVRTLGFTVLFALLLLSAWGVSSRDARGRELAQAVSANPEGHRHSILLANWGRV